MRFFMKKNGWDGSERRNKDRLKKVRMQNFKNLFRISNLRKRLLIYFVLIIFVAMSVGMQLIFEVGSMRMQNHIAEAVKIKTDEAGTKSADISGVAQVLKRFQQRMILIMTIVFICIVATMFVFIRNIVEPLDLLGKSARRITDGHLDETVPIRSNDEIGNIGELINDLAINLQEVLLHVWNHTCQDIRLMDQVAEIIHAQPGDIMPVKIREQFDFVRHDIEEMQEIVKAFDYYNIHFEGDSLVGNEAVSDDVKYGRAVAEGKITATAVADDNYEKSESVPIAVVADSSSGESTDI